MKNKQIHILYIEDNPGHARLMTKRLEKDGKFKVDWVNDPVEGLNKAKQQYDNYDVILVDYNLSGKSGLEFIRLITAYKDMPPTIMITGSGSEEVAVKALQSGASNYVVKDVDSNYLLLMPIVIYSTINKHRLEKEKKRAENELKQANALLKAEQEAISSGILVVDIERKIIRYTKRFLEIWNIPENLAKEGKDEKLLSYVAESIENTDKFNKLVESIYQHPEEERTGDIVELKSGRILSRNTRPVCFEDGKIIGRLWDFEDITERKKQEKQIKQLAFNDALTGLPNRRTFYDRLSVAIAEAKRNKLMLAVIFIDLVKFKEVNDTLGHDMGDKVLKTVTEKMCIHLRESDTLARIGGDEFILLIPKINKKEDAQTVAEKFVETFRTPLIIDGHEILAGLSMGAGFYPDDGKEPDILVKKADEAMYRAKQSGRNNFKMSQMLYPP